MLWGTYRLLVEVPEAKDLLENRTVTQFSSLGSGGGDKGADSWHLRWALWWAGAPWEHLA